MLALQRPPQLGRSIALIALCLGFLPINIYLLLSCYVLQILSPYARARRAKHVSPRRVLISGTDNAVGLALARNLYLRGHHVIGADYQKYRLRGPGRLSKSIRKSYRNPGRSEELGIANYMHSLLEVVQKEKIDIYISCASFTTAAEDATTKSVIEKLTDCKCIAFDPETTESLSSRPAFLELAKSTGLEIPVIHSVTSRDQIHKLLGPSSSKEKSYTLTKVRPNRKRVDASGNALLPRRSVSQTYQFVSQLAVSNDDPYVLEEHVTGEEYCTYVLLSKGFIEAFVACLEPRDQHVERLQLDSPLYHALLRSTKLLTTKLSEDFSGPLTFSFRVQMRLTTAGFEKRLVPRACVPKIGLPSLLLDASHRNPVTKSETLNGRHDALFSLQGNYNVYWISTDYLNLVLLPLRDVLLWRKSIYQLWSSCIEFMQHVLFWKEANFVIWDPLPFFWLYAVYWPSRLGLALVSREKWNVLDVTTNELSYDL